MNSSQTADKQQRSLMEPGVIIAIVLGFILPGAGHLYLKKLARAAIYFVSITSLVIAGVLLHGTLFSLLRMNSGNGFLQLLASIGNLGLGLGHFILHAFNLGNSDITIRTNEYGTTFLIVAALLNVLVVLNAMDIAVGEKE
jgi:TM2 domain-containing membrane protein YozV